MARELNYSSTCAAPLNTTTIQLRSMPHWLNLDIWWHTLLSRVKDYQFRAYETQEVMVFAYLPNKNAKWKETCSALPVASVSHELLTVANDIAKWSIVRRDTQIVETQNLNCTSDGWICISCHSKQLLQFFQQLCDQLSITYKHTSVHSLHITDNWSKKLKGG